MKTSHQKTLLSIVVTGDEPPTEFKVFTADTVETSKGDFIFDDDAAKSVMASYEKHGIDLMIDYDHASLAWTSLDPAQSGKAAGWFNLQMRGGELWAVNVRWTPSAATALRAKEWRFMSPAFETKDDRIVGLLNVAITNIPATHRLDPLMAASVRGENAMTLEELLKVCKVLGLDLSTTTVEEAMAKMSGQAPPDAEDAPPPAGDGGADESTETDPSTTTAAAAPAADGDKGAEVTAASARIMRLTGKSSWVDALVEIESWRMSHVTREADVAKLAKERSALEFSKRKDNAIALTKLGAETPHTTGLAKGKLCKRLLDEPIEEQTARVAALLSARGGKLPGGPIVPSGGGEADALGLSPREIAKCNAKKIDVAVYAKQKADIAARSTNAQRAQED